MVKLSDTFCACCGKANSLYEVEGHNRECIWYEDEMVRLAAKWLKTNEDANWKSRYDLIVQFFINQRG